VFFGFLNNEDITGGIKNQEITGNSAATAKAITDCVSGFADIARFLVILIGIRVLFFI
jgi:hypothetical protein